jgi:hypothetical protein
MTRTIQQLSTSPAKLHSSPELSRGLGLQLAQALGSAQVNAQFAQS